MVISTRWDSSSNSFLMFEEFLTSNDNMVDKIKNDNVRDSSSNSFLMFGGLLISNNNMVNKIKNDLEDCSF